MAGYTRQDTANNIANGNVIDADDFDAEYNAVEAAFNASTGHKHDGTAGEGAPIEKVGPSQDLIVTATKVEAKTTNTLDLGSSGVQFKDGFFDGTLNTDVLTVDESATVGTTLGVTGAATLSSTLDVTGNTTVGGTLGVTGATGIDGNFDINTDKFTVASASGNTAIAGTLAVTGASTLTGNVTASGTMDITGNTSVDGNFDVNTDKFTVASTTGNTTVAGTLAVTGASTLTGAVSAPAGVTGDLTGNADTATTLETAVNFSLTGDVTASAVSFDGSGNVELTTAMANNSVDLGTHTTGNYMVGVSEGTGVTITHTPSEGSTATVAIGQDVSTSSNVTFNDITVSNNLTVSGSTTSINTTTLNVADNMVRFNSDATGSPSEDVGIEVERGDLANKFIYWDESEDEWTVGSDTFKAGAFTGPLTGEVTGNADTASTWETARSITLTGDVTGTVTGVNGGANISIDTTVAANSVALGTDTTGAYVSSLVAGTGVTLSNNSGETATPTIAIGQAVSTTSNVTFNDVVVSGDLTVSGTTTTVNTETINLADNVITLNSNASGTPTQNGGIEVERGTATNKTLIWNETDDKWTVGSETFVAGTFEGDLTGTVQTAAQPNITSLGTLTTLTVDDLSLNNSQIYANAPLEIKTNTQDIILNTGSEIDLYYQGTKRGGINLDLANTIGFSAGAFVEMYIRESGVNIVNGLVVGTSSTTPTDNDIYAQADIIAGQRITAGNDVYVGDDIIMTAGASDWKFEVGASNELNIYYGATKLFKLDSSGNLTVRGDVTAKDTSL